MGAVKHAIMFESMSLRTQMSNSGEFELQDLSPSRNAENEFEEESNHPHRYQEENLRSDSYIEDSVYDNDEEAAPVDLASMCDVQSTSPATRPPQTVIDRTTIGILHTSLAKYPHKPEDATFLISPFDESEEHLKNQVNDSLDMSHQPGCRGKAASSPDDDWVSHRRQAMGVGIVAFAGVSTAVAVIVIATGGALAPVAALAVAL